MGEERLTVMQECEGISYKIQLDVSLIYNQQGALSLAWDSEPEYVKGIREDSRAATFSKATYIEQRGLG